MRGSNINFEMPSNVYSSEKEVAIPRLIPKEMIINYRPINF